jgi:eukaryotic-like serine/threonine-protein kinase
VPVSSDAPLDAAAVFILWSVTSDDAPAGDTVLDGRYRLLSRLGSGGMAVVWVARDKRLGRDVAVKVLSDVLAGHADYRRRFEREARVAAGLNHPGLVGIHDFSAESERPFLVMELIRGDTLAERIAAGRTAELDPVALARELLSALAYIHAAGVVHRDVKPGNVLIDADGRPRLTDFGIARPEDATALTQTGQVIGTRSYMAPELQRGEPATPRSDLYALGVTLEECGGGRDPALASLIDRLRASDPAERPASADQALASLTGTAATVPGPATEATKPLPATGPTAPLAGDPGAGPPAGERHRGLAPGGVLAALAVLAAIALAVVLVSGGEERSPSDSGQPGQATATPGEQAPEPARTSPESEAPPAVSCSAIEEEKKALEEEKKAAEEGAGDDEEAKKAIQAQFEARKKALEEREKSCEGD